ncbi:MAG: FtsX-like permease family protein [Flavobacteriales bacterium]|nr:FtsX-like permease family protein [Flavobacteriales bacterium]
MFSSDRWQEILTGMLQNPFRTFLTMNAIGIGIFILVILQGMGGGLQNGAYSSFDDATNTIWVRSGRTSLPYAGYRSNRQVDLHVSDHEKARKEIAKTDISTARLQFWGRPVKYKDQVSNFSIRCVHPGHQYTEMTEMVTGRYINQGDIDEERKVAVIGQTVVEDLFGDTDPIGKMISVMGANFFVVGTFNDPNSRWENRIVYFPFSTGMKLYGGNTGKISNFIVSTEDKDLQASEAMAETMDLELRGKYSIHPNDPKGIDVSNQNAEFAIFQNMFLGIKIFLFFMGFFTLLAGVIGVSTIMSIVVQDRTKEIGVRKAIGASPFSIVSMIIQESFFITFLSGLIGFILAYLVLNGVAQVVEHEYFKNPTVNLQICLLAMTVLSTVGVIAGLIPARKAAKIKPVEALKDE